MRLPKGEYMKVQGNQLVGTSGESILLRGAMIESGFAYSNSWKNRGEASVTDVLNPTVFKAMANDWKMNAVRVNISCWMYTGQGYLTLLDQVIGQANEAGLYVILDLHDDLQSGSRHGNTGFYPKAENVQFWRDIAQRYKGNEQVLFDLFNEPHSGNWQQWWNGGQSEQDAHGTTVQGVGFKSLVETVRGVGAENVIVLEPGQPWNDFDPSIVTDSNVVYSKHIYESIIDPPDKQAAQWGKLLDNFPLYYGEWGFLANTTNTAHCQHLPTDPAQATEVINTFLQFCDDHKISWTGWSFTAGHMIVDEQSLTPTTLNIAWTCGQLNPKAGMGEVVKAWQNKPVPPAQPVPPPDPLADVKQQLADVVTTLQSVIEKL